MIAFALLAAAAAAQAPAVPPQGFGLASARLQPTLVGMPSAPALLGGTDDCSQPHLDLGAGPFAGFPFTTGTTGTEGQNEPGCNSSPPPGMASDVWFDWTADRDGRASWRTCGGTIRDTRLIVWPFSGSASCPADGTSIACDDGACGYPSSVTWDVTAGTTYTLQLGLRPGEPATSGTFDLTIFDGPSCGRYDDGSTENAFGHHLGELGWLHMYDCFVSVESVQTAYGTLLFPGNISNGAGSRIAVYDDLDDDGDARTGMQLLEVVSTLVTNANTDILSDVPFPGGPVQVQGGMAVLASADHWVAQYPAPMDRDNPTPHAWVVFHTTGPGSLNLDDLNDNDVPVTRMVDIGYPTAWLLRAVGSEVAAGLSFCPGDGTGAPCPCGNRGGSGEGCANSTGAGCRLEVHGSASVASDDLRFDASQLPAFQPTILFAGDAQPGGGSGLSFGDGLRCAGGSAVRLGVETADGTGLASWGPGLGARGGWSAGDTRYFQAWYRDPPGPCGSGFNLSNGIELSFVR